MSSVSVSWTGACTSATEQDELLSYVGRLAEVNDILLNGKLPPRRHPFLELITAKRAEGLKPRPNVEVVEQQIAGKIVVNANVFADAREFEDGVLPLNLPILDHAGPDARESTFVLNLAASSSQLICLDLADIRGINFRVYDPRQLYPGEDRISFLFPHCAYAPFLDGRICEAFHPAECPGLIEFGGLPAADWYIRRPEIHLAGYLEEWLDVFLAWMKYFYIPDLGWWHHGPMVGSQIYRREFEVLHARQQSVGPAAAKAESFEGLTDAFFLEAGKCYAEVMAFADSAAGGPPGSSSPA